MFGGVTKGGISADIFFSAVLTVSTRRSHAFHKGKVEMQDLLPFPCKWVVHVAKVWAAILEPSKGARIRVEWALVKFGTGSSSGVEGRCFKGPSVYYWLSTFPSPPPQPRPQPCTACQDLLKHQLLPLGPSMWSVPLAKHPQHLAQLLAPSRCFINNHCRNERGKR